MPAVIFLLIVVIYPLIKVFEYSFHEYSGGFVFVGLRHYKTLFADELFWTSLKNTSLFTAGTIFLDLSLAWGIALLLNSKWPHHKLRNFFRGALILPFLFSAPASALLWGILYQPLGFLNFIIERLFGTTLNFLGDPQYALFSVLWVSVWRNFPLIMILVLGGLQSIPRNLHEAARIDGANRIQRLWFVTLPQMRSLMATIIVIDFATTFIHFDLVWTMTQGGPLRSTY
ncbi:sugar ABC transporter permease, partial [Candidatus Aerophobetes bacterium]|nr:sugar ABC transporter permease [Candidatus Aerophobetes bacterium]